MLKSGQTRKKEESGERPERIFAICFTVAFYVLIFSRPEAAAQQLAFPGAEGYGAYGLGGRGGDVYHVTNLTDDRFNPQPGSLRYGITSATGPRTVVFDVSGYIDLAYRLEITVPNLTIAGQTAPGAGITIRKHDIRLYNTHDTIIRYLRVRTGYYSSGQYTSPDLPGGLDALSVEGSTDVIIDHVSTSWGRDEQMSVSGDSTDVTIQWSTLTEPLDVDYHSKGSLMRPAMNSSITCHHNLYAHPAARVTRFGNYNDGVVTRFDWYNNVVYDWGWEPTYSYDNNRLWNYVIREADGPGADGEFPDMNFMNNYFIAGPDTEPNVVDVAYQADNWNARIWAAGNRMDSDRDGDHDGIDTGWDMIGNPHPGMEWANHYTPMNEPFAITAPITLASADNAYDQVLAGVGMSLARDAVDERVINEVITRTGGVIVTQNDVGGWPDIPETYRAAGFDTDQDGMPGVWELARGLNPADPSDRNGDGDSDGYTNLEEYLNWLTEKPAATYSLSGTVTFQYPGRVSGGAPVMYQVRTTSSPPAPPIYEGTINASLTPGNPATGSFEINAIPDGIYDVALKHANHIAGLVTQVLVDGADVTGLEVTLWAGDADGDDEFFNTVYPDDAEGDNDVELADYYTLFYQYHGGLPLTTGYNADFDGDGDIDLDDYCGLCYGYLNAADPGNWY